MRAKIFFHVGLHKTGTTFLQENIFSKFKKDEVNYIRYPSLDMLIDTKRINLVSEENLSGEPQVGIPAYIRFIIAYRLSLLFPSAKIIIGLRDRESWVKSLYSQYIRQGGTKDYKYWFENVFDRYNIDFKSYISFLESRFNTVFVYNFNDFCNNQEEVIRSICDFIGADVPIYDKKIKNMGLKPYQLKITRFFNMFQKSKLNNKGIFTKNYYFNTLRLFDVKKQLINMLDKKGGVRRNE